MDLLDSLCPCVLTHTQPASVPVWLCQWGRDRDRELGLRWRRNQGYWRWEWEKEGEGSVGQCVTVARTGMGTSVCLHSDELVSEQPPESS